MKDIDDAFDDAHRRVCLAKRRNAQRPDIWTGLAFPSAMKSMIARGWMRPVCNEHRRVLNWYTFTDAGWIEYDRRYAGKPDWFALTPPAEHLASIRATLAIIRKDAWIKASRLRATLAPILDESGQSAGFEVEK